MSKIYEVVSPYVYVLNLPSTLSRYLGIYYQGTRVEVDGIYGAYGLISHSGQKAYIQLSSLKELTGFILVRYIQEGTEIELSPSFTDKDLPLGSYTYKFLEIPGYTLIGDEIEIVNLTAKHSRKRVNFIYKKLPQPKIKDIGTLTIKYIEAKSNLEIFPSETIKNIPLGTHSYKAEKIEGYSLLGNDVEIVELTNSNYNKLLFFFYEIQYPKDNINESEIPYIALFHFNPIIVPNEEVTLDIYITDYNHSELIDDNFKEEFTVTVLFESKPKIVVEGLLQGAHSVNIGSFTKIGKEKFTIYCTDKYKRKSTELMNYFMINE